MEKLDLQEIARKAAVDLAEDLGPDAVFPFDKLREYIPGDLKSEIPATRFQHTFRSLLKDGLLELTGNHTTAVSPERAGSPTREYRLGPILRGGQGGSIGIGESEADDYTVAALLKRMVLAMEGRGFIFTEPELANFYLALKTSPLVILAGASGTGKSQLPRLFAELTNSNFQLISVQPQWSDNADLLGYTSALRGGEFVPGRIVKTIQAANSSEGLWVVLLDEMNLAAVEHYFSDFLSVIETRRKERGKIVTDCLPLELPTVADVAADPFADLRTLILPPNLKVIGTANMDETTRLFSPKVLDRAFTIEFDEVDLGTFPTEGEEGGVELRELATRLLRTDAVFVQEAYSKAEVLFDRASELLEEVRDKLKPGSITFGYRTRDQVVMYLYHWQRDELGDILDLNAAFDFCLLQKVLPKVSGTGTALLNALDALALWLEATHPEIGGPTGLTGPFLRSATRVRRMRLRLEAEGAVFFWES